MDWESPSSAKTVLLPSTAPQQSLNLVQTHHRPDTMSSQNPQPPQDPTQTPRNPAQAPSVRYKDPSSNLEELPTSVPKNYTKDQPQNVYKVPMVGHDGVSRSVDEPQSGQPAQRLPSIDTITGEGGYQGKGVQLPGIHTITSHIGRGEQANQAGASNGSNQGGGTN